MKKFKLILLLTTTFLYSCASYSESMLLIVDAEEIRDSNVTAAELCGSSKDCISWETYFIYEVKINDILHGGFISGDIVVANSQHAGYVNKKINNWMILVRKIKDPALEKKLEAQYIVEKSSFPEQYYCFDSKPGDVIDKRFITRLTSSSEDYFCYSLDDLPERE